MFSPLYTADEMRAAEEGHDVEAMMDRAGRAVADAILRRYPDARRIGAVCGKGANGGDGRIALRVLAEAGRETSEELDGCRRRDRRPVRDGVHGAPRDDAARLIEDMHWSGAPIVAVDLPSGVDASTGEIAGAAVVADVTVTMHAPKVGVAVAPGRFHAGEVEVADIGIPPGQTRHRLVTEEILELVPRKHATDTKYSAGSVLVVGGSPGMSGAVCLAGNAAFRADAGYVAVATHPQSLPLVEALVLEAVKAPLDEVDRLAERAGAVAVGPGLGRGEEERALVRRLLRELPARRCGRCGRAVRARAGRLARAPRADTAFRRARAAAGREDVDAHRLDAVRAAADRFGCIVLLKGADTLVAAPGEGVLVCAAGTPALATAGSGDVLTGVVAAFLAKGIDARLATAAAAYAHGRAAELGPERGLIASDLVEALPDVLA